MGSLHGYGDESMQRTGSGTSMDIKSEQSVSSKESSSRSRSTKFSAQKRDEFVKKVVDKEEFAIHIHDWLSAKVENLSIDEYAFNSPFQLRELYRFDYALQGIIFQQLFRMPLETSSLSSGEYDRTAYLALEDFLYVAADGLWKAFWYKDDPLPFQISCLAEKTERHCGAALVVKCGKKTHFKWNDVAALALLNASVTDNCQDKEQTFSVKSISLALFYGFQIMLSRKSNKSSRRIKSDCVYIVVVDSRGGGVVKLKGDINKLRIDPNSIYECASDWLQQAEVTVSPVYGIWNKLGNANWGDIGTLQVLLATFYCIMHAKGKPRRSIAELATDHISRLQNRWSERFHFYGAHETGDDVFCFPQSDQLDGEIVEISQYDTESCISKEMELEVLEPGSEISLEISELGRTYIIREVFSGGSYYFYGACSMQDPESLYTLYVGAHSPQQVHSWEDMNMWYLVQRQTKILNVLKQRALSCRYLPRLVDSGKVVHRGRCHRSSSGNRCDHLCCGMPVLVFFPIGEPLSTMKAPSTPFTRHEALQCCHDILSALQCASQASVQHGNICLEHIICVVESGRDSYFVLVNWGHAVIEERDSPPMNLQFSSTYALQEGKLCPSSDAESLVYLLYHLCGGACEQFESIEAALLWRERSWAKRLIQQHLGQVSSLLKAFADYVDSLCGTPYPVDYEIWIKRLARSLLSNRCSNISENSLLSKVSGDDEIPGKIPR